MPLLKMLRTHYNVIVIPPTAAAFVVVVAVVVVVVVLFLWRLEDAHKDKLLGALEAQPLASNGIVRAQPLVRPSVVFAAHAALEMHACHPSPRISVVIIVVVISVEVGIL